MAARVPLPAKADLPELVLFHRDHPSEPQVILQVPNEDRTDSETFVIDLENQGHIAWLESLPCARELKDQFMLSQHVSYCPRTGFIRDIPDLDEPSVFALQLAESRRKASGGASIFDRYFARRATQRGHGQQVPGVSKMRRALGSKLK